MRPTSPVISAIRTSAVVVFSLATIASTAIAQRNLSDPGRLYREHAAKLKAARTGPPAYNLFLTPTFGWANNIQSFGGQFKYTSDDLIPNIPVAFSGSLASTHFTAPGASTNRTSTQLDAEFDVLSKPEYVLALSGQMAHIGNVGTNWEFAPEFDWTLPKNDMFTGAVGGILYMDDFKPVGGLPSAGMQTTIGLLAYLNNGSWGFIPEYDFPSNTNGQNNVLSIKVSKGFEKMNHDPRLMFGAARSGGVNNFLAGVRVMLH